MPPCANIFIYTTTSIIESSYSDHKLNDFVQKQENKVFRKYAELFIFNRNVYVFIIYHDPIMLNSEFGWQ